MSVPEETTTTNRLRLRWQPGDQATSIDLDVRSWSGEVIEELEAHLGGEPVVAWARRMAAAMSRGVRFTESRAIDIIGLVYLGVAHEQPGMTWRDMARSINPYTLELVDGSDVVEDDEDDEDDEDEQADEEPVAEPEPPAAQAARQVSPVVAALAERRVAEIGMPAVVLPAAE